MDAVGFDELPDGDPWWGDEGPGDTLVCTDPDYQLGPEHLLAEAEQAGPGSCAQHLLAALTSRDVTRDQWLTAVQLWEAQEAWLVGQKALAVAGFAGPTPVSVAGFRDDEALSLELAMAVGCSDGYAYDQIVAARLLSSTLSATGDLLRAGRLSPYRARLITTELGPLHPEVARQVEATILDTAAQVPTGLLRKRLARHAKRMDPHRVNDRRVAELAERTPGRRVVFDPDAGDGLMGMYAYLPPVEALAMRAALKTAAGSFRTADGRGQEAREADALTGMVLGFDPDHPGKPVRPKMKIGVLIDLPTLLGLRDNGGELLGYGHLPSDVVRELADHASWQRLVYDPVNGYLLDAGTTVHDMPALSEFITLRDRRDRFPGGTRSHPLDLDHTIAFKPAPEAETLAQADEFGRPVEPGAVVEQDEECEPDEASGPLDETGTSALNEAAPTPTVVAPLDTSPVAPPGGADEGGHTSANNLAALSRRHHRAKTFLGFSYRQLGLGVLEWTTPLGRTYRTYPHDYRPEGPGAEGDSDPPPPA